MVAAVLALASVVMPGGFRRYLSLRQEAEILESRNAGMRDESERLMREIEALRGDPRALERAAREELGFVKPGEIILNLE